jgi:hypothetical protein
LERLNGCKSGTEARRILETFAREKEEGDSAPAAPLYGSISIAPGASVRGISDGDLAIQTRLVNKRYRLEELIDLSGDRDADRASISILSLTVAGSIAALAANQSLPGPDIVRFLVVWVFCFAPLAFVGYGIADADRLQTVLVSIQRRFFPAYCKRMVQHEAGHFLMGHLLGWPVAGYSANAVKNAVTFYPLSDDQTGRDFASQLGFDAPVEREIVSRQHRQLQQRQGGAPYFSREGRGGTQLGRSTSRKKEAPHEFSKLAARDEPTTAWPFRGFDETTLDQLTAVSVAGVCSELLAFGNAEGGIADFGQLQQIFQSAEEEISEREAENRIRFAIAYTMTQLRRHLGALDALAEVMERGGSVAECVMAIEGCENVSGQDGILGDYEVRRREAFRSEQVNWIERLFLSGSKNMDTDKYDGVTGASEEDSIWNSIRNFRMTGDDPVYAALALAFAFLVWASSGGLSLH